MDYFLNLLGAEGIDLTSILVIGILLYLGVTEVKKRKKESDTSHEEELKEYHEKESLKESKEKHTNERLEELEMHDENDYKRIQQMESHLYEITESIKSLTKTVEMIQIENKRTMLLNAPSQVTDLTKPVSVELYDNIFKTYSEYEALLKDVGMENGQTELSMQVVRSSWIKRTENGLFTEVFYLTPEKANKKICEVSTTLTKIINEQKQNQEQDAKNEV